MFTERKSKESEIIAGEGKKGVTFC